VFEIPANGPKGKTRELTIIGNHFKSKGGDDPLFGVNQPAVRETEVQRKLQARVVRDYANTVLDTDPGVWLIVTGDLNDFQFGEPSEGLDHPLAILEGKAGEVPLINLVRREKRAERYSFVFDGNSQVLDHTLISPAMRRAAVGIDFLHFNAGFPSALSEDASTPVRSADHDPLELRLRIR
jgi:predicted extracellular nuclease